jgi:predicted site-specific integrase-resolvase
MRVWSIHIRHNNSGDSWRIGQYLAEMGLQGSLACISSSDKSALLYVLVRDLIAIVTVFSARLHGLRSHK